MTDVFRPPVRVTWSRTVTQEFEAVVDIEDLPSDMADAYYRGDAVDWIDWLQDYEAENDPLRERVEARTKELVEEMFRGICLACEWSTPFYTSPRVVDAALIVHGHTEHRVIP